MFLLIGFAFLAGVVTVLSPCILPVLPVVLSGSVGGGKARPWGIITGFVVSFTIFTLLLSALVQVLGISPDVLRWVAAGLVLLFGLVMVIPFVKDKFMEWTTKLTSRSSTSAVPGKPQGGYWSGVVLGLSLGLVWTPCVGPIMASVISLALSQSIDAGSVFITLAYSLGTAVPLFLIMQGGRTLLKKLPFLTKHTGTIQKVFGGLMILTALALFTGADRAVQTWLLQTFPQYGAGLTAIEDQAAVKSELDRRNAQLTTTVQAVSDESVDHLSLSPGAWINSEPLTLAGLKGKVVLVDIWTYSCINCLRTLPYLRAWYDKYKDKGLVIVGVHSPEFAFEKVEANVRKAVSDLGVTWPVVQDNDFSIWRSYKNQYWPAHYLYGKNGTLVETHFGEGDYVETEKKIQELLGAPGPVAAEKVTSTITSNDARSPETYLGFERGRGFSSPEDVSKNRVETYSEPGALGLSHWALSGKWTIGAENVQNEGVASLSYHFAAQKVYLVINRVPDSQTKVRVTVDGKPVTGGDVKDGVLTLDTDRLYQLFDGPAMINATVKLEFSGPAKAFAFTFG